MMLPLVGLAGFGSYYAYWQAKAPERLRQAFLARTESAWRLKQYERRDGTEEAVADLRSGRRKLKTGGCAMVPWTVEFMQICGERFGITEDPVYGPWSTAATDRYVGDYNRVVWRYIAFNHHVSENDVWDAAEQRFRLRHPRTATTGSSRADAEAERGPDNLPEAPPSPRPPAPPSPSSGAPRL